MSRKGYINHRSLSAGASTDDGAWWAPGGPGRLRRPWSISRAGSGGSGPHRGRRVLEGRVVDKGRGQRMPSCRRGQIGPRRPNARMIGRRRSQRVCEKPAILSCRVLSEHRGTAGAGVSVLREHPTGRLQRLLVHPFRPPRPVPTVRSPAEAPRSRAVGTTQARPRGAGGRVWRCASHDVERDAAAVIGTIDPRSEILLSRRRRSATHAPADGIALGRVSGQIAQRPGLTDCEVYPKDAPAPKDRRAHWR